MTTGADIVRTALAEYEAEQHKAMLAVKCQLLVAALDREESNARLDIAVQLLADNLFGSTQKAANAVDREYEKRQRAHREVAA